MCAMDECGDSRKNRHREDACRRNENNDLTELNLIHNCCPKELPVINVKFQISKKVDISVIIQLGKTKLCIRFEGSKVISWQL